MSLLQTNCNNFRNDVPWGPNTMYFFKFSTNVRNQYYICLYHLMTCYRNSVHTSLDWGVLKAIVLPTLITNPFVDFGFFLTFISINLKISSRAWISMLCLLKFDPIWTGGKDLCFKLTEHTHLGLAYPHTHTQALHIHTHTHLGLAYPHTHT